MKHWKQTEEYLRQAAAELPQDQVAQALEYLDHNELGLALEELSAIAEGLGIVTAEFWRPLAKAGTLMINATYENI